MLFEPTTGASRTVPHALRVSSGDGKTRYLRLSHQFGGIYYGMWVTDAAAARDAGRPIAFTIDTIQRMEAEGGVWGRLSPPDDLLRKSRPDEPDPTDGAWRIIRPLVEAFSVERNLKRQVFSRLIDERAREIGAAQKTVSRLIKRYYYFGQIREALAPLLRGPRPQISEPLPDRGAAGAPPKDGESSRGKRRGPKSSLEERYGKNEFVVQPEDIADMVFRLETMGTKGRTYTTDAYEEYLSVDFKKRHPDVFAAYEREEHPAPVSLGQFRSYTSEYVQLTKELARNLRTKAAGRGRGGSLDAMGPADIYEIDATYGRIVLTTSGEKRRLVATPTIYFIIDRWSRFIVSFYVSLKAPAWDEVRYALLIAFSSREARFRAMGIDVDDQIWPVGRVCAVLRRDRGSELMSESMEVVAGDIRFDPSALPPRTPNGKAIVERLIRTIKAKMANAVTGTYADRPTDYHGKRDAKKAKQLTVHSLSEVYLEIMKIVLEYNNSTHTRLKRLQILAANGVKPTPQAAYLWGVRNITGARLSSLSDTQLQRMLLGTDSASIADGEIRYKGWRFRPVNAAGRQMAARSTSKAKSIAVRVDKTFPHELFVASRPEWAHFEMMAADRSTLGTATLDEVAARAALMNAEHREAEHEEIRARVTGKARVKTKRPEIDRKPSSQRQLADDRQSESSDIKAKLTGKKQRPAAAAGTVTTSSKPSVPEWKRRELERRNAEIDQIRKTSEDE